MHSADEIEDNRRRVHRDGTSVDRIEFPPLRLSTSLGLWVRTVLWHRIEELLEQTGGPVCGWTRDFKRQHMTPEMCAHIVNSHFPGFVDRGNAILEAQKGRPLRREERVEFKLYRYIHSGYHDKSEDDPEKRFGVNLGDRHWTKNKAMNNLMKDVQNIFTRHGPLLCFYYDMDHPESMPVREAVKP